MDIFGINHLMLIPYEISSKKVDAMPNIYTLNDFCFFTSGIDIPLNLAGYSLIVRNILS